jgi:hypothetical protein
MAEKNKIECTPPASLIKGMSVYASSADYERRLSEHCAQAPGPDLVNASEAEDR